MSTRYQISDNSSLLTIKNTFNSFLEDLSTVEIKQLLTNPLLLSSSSSGGAGWECLHISNLQYNSLTKISSFSIGANGYLKQNITDQLVGAANYTAVVTTNVPATNALKFSIEVSGADNQIFNIKDLSQLNTAVEILDKDTKIYKHTLQFNTSASGISGDIQLTLRNISASSLNLQIKGFSLYRGLAEVGSIIATSTPPDSLLAGKGLTKDEAIGSDPPAYILNLALSGTDNQVIVNDSASAGFIQLSLPQDISEDSEVTFEKVTTHSVSSEKINNVTLSTSQPSASLQVTNNAIISGTNTGDQVIILQGNVAGSGTGIINATISDTTVTSKKLTGFTTPTATASTPVIDSDSILGAIEKLQNSIDLLKNEKYPIGSIYSNVNNPNNPSDPALLGYGQWSPFGEGRVLVGAGNVNGIVYTATVSGGESTHKLTIDEMPQHTHETPHSLVWPVGLGSNVVEQEQAGSPDNFSGYQNNTEITGGGGAHNNMQPYVVVYMWWRTA